MKKVKVYLKRAWRIVFITISAIAGSISMLSLRIAALQVSKEDFIDWRETVVRIYKIAYNEGWNDELE